MQLYTYGDSTWKDLLTAVNGQTISYDAGGDPVSYLGHTLTWQKGRQLKSFDSNTYTYNANGIRTAKTVDRTRHDYTIEGVKILREKWGTNTIVPCYDNEGAVCGIIYNDTPYYFVKNLQGDVIAITDTTGAVVARYSYDAWGVPTTVSDTTEIGIAEINPYRYRSYYYDSEIGMYYLQSRYYDPTLSRFINADEANYAVTSCHNLFTYCENEPVRYIDVSGHCYSYVPAFDIYGGLTYELGDGWTYVIHNKGTSNEHIHVWHRQKSKGNYSQNKDGTPHDKGNNGPGDSPPKSVKKKLKDKGKWDWDGNVKQLASNSNDYETWKYAIAVTGVTYLLYRGVRMLISALPPLWWTAPINVAIP